jgi:hypothetical protein
MRRMCQRCPNSVRIIRHVLRGHGPSTRGHVRLCARKYRALAGPAASGGHRRCAHGCGQQQKLVSDAAPTAATRHRRRAARSHNYLALPADPARDSGLRPGPDHRTGPPGHPPASDRTTRPEGPQPHQVRWSWPITTSVTGVPFRPGSYTVEITVPELVATRIFDTQSRRVDTPGSRAYYRG